MSQDQVMWMTIMLVYRYEKTGYYDYVLFCPFLFTYDVAL